MILVNGDNIANPSLASFLCLETLSQIVFCSSILYFFSPLLNNIQAMKSQSLPHIDSKLSTRSSRCVSVSAAGLSFGDIDIDKSSFNSVQSLSSVPSFPSLESQTPPVISIIPTDNEFKISEINNIQEIQSFTINNPTPLITSISIHESNLVVEASEQKAKSLVITRTCTSILGHKYLAEVTETSPPSLADSFSS